MNLFQSIVKLFDIKEEFALATILSRSGSAPRAAGTRMVVRPNGSIIGTVGGGVLEAQVQQLAHEVIQDKATVVRKFVLTPEDAGDMGMICGGELQVMIQYVNGTETSNLRLYEAILLALRTRNRSCLLTSIPADGKGSDPPRQSLIGSDGSVTGWEEAKDLGIHTRGMAQPEIIERNGDRYLLEPLCCGGTVYIFGAGHIAQKLAPLTTLVGFYTVVLDDREDFANRHLFPSPDEVIVLDSFESAMDGLDIDEQSCLVLVTRGHSHDKTLLRLALRTKAGYIGMIGSRRKRDGIYRALELEGIDASHFERVHSPIGLDIGAETPEEIALSIAAELVQKRAEKGR